MKYYWHNIGSPDSQEWWECICSENIITTGSDQLRNDGQSILKSYNVGDIFIAHSKKYGALGVGEIVVNASKAYKLINDNSCIALFKHRHMLHIKWLYIVEDIEDGIPPTELRDDYKVYNLCQPEHTHESILPNRALKLIETLSSVCKEMG